MNLTPRRLLVLAVLVVLGAAALGFASHLRTRVRAKKTAGRILELSTMLLAERPQHVSAAALSAVARKYGREDVLTDAWGAPLLVEREGAHYVVTSLARDGKRGGCCVPPDRATPDTDLIAVDGIWRQVWN